MVNFERKNTVTAITREIQVCIKNVFWICGNCVYKINESAMAQFSQLTT